MHKHRMEYILLLFMGVVYFWWVRSTGIGIPCLFRQITGWRCPGCGTTTLLVYISHGNFRGAQAANPFVFYTLPFLVSELVFTGCLARKRKKSPGWNRALLILYCAAFLVFGVLRNIPFIAGY